MTRTHNVSLTLAINEYDHVRDILSGAVTAGGIDLTCVPLVVEETFFRFSRYREWEVSELSLAKFVSLRDRDEVVGIPVFPSRMFRHSALFVRAGAGIEDPADLAGGRIGFPEWTQTATVYVRGLLANDYGVRLQDVAWFQGGVNEPGRVEGIPIGLPPGIDCTAVADRTLNDMLVAGELDAVISAHPPTDLKAATGRLRRLFGDPRAAEEAYFRATGVFPIMHTVALRRDVYERHPWVAMNLLKAFQEAKDRSVARAIDATASMFPVPWGTDDADRARELFGQDLWPYGIEPNRVTLETFLGYAHEQGLTRERLDAEDLFVPEVQESFRI